MVHFKKKNVVAGVGKRNGYISSHVAYQKIVISLDNLKIQILKMVLQISSNYDGIINSKKCLDSSI